MKNGAYRWWLLFGFGLALTGMAIFLAACSGNKAPEPATSSAPATPTAPTVAFTGLAVAVEQTVCPVSGEAIDKRIFIDYQGRRIYFCCPMCEDKFNADPAKYLAILDGKQPFPTGGMQEMNGSAPAAPAAAHDHSAHSHGSDAHGSAAPASSSASSTAVKYTCPMHLEIVTDAPGRCPKCGMNLVPKE